MPSKVAPVEKSHLSAKSVLNDPWASKWLDRWSGLEQHINNLRAEAESPNVPRGRVLSLLLQGLHTFGERHFFFFLNGLSSLNTPDQPDFDPVKRPRLAGDSRFTSDFVMAQVIQRIAEDVRMIQNCLTDRLLYKQGGTMQAALNTADLLAYASLIPAKQTRQPHAAHEGEHEEETLVPAHANAITQFHKSPFVRLMPYAPVALVAVPQTLLTEPRDFLAIPHEVGHYVMAYGENHGAPYHEIEKWIRDAVRAIEENLDQGPDNVAETQLMSRYLQNWSEEIFADVYGGLVAGRPIALSFQELENTSALSEFLSDDGHHPSPIVRPRIYAQVVAAAWRDQPDAEGLEANWQKQFVEQRAGADADVIMFNEDGHLMAERRVEVEALLDELSLAILREFFSDASGNILNPGAISALNLIGGQQAPLRAPIDVELVFETFAKNLATLKDDPLLRDAFTPEKDIFPTTGWDEWAEHHGYQTGEEGIPIPARRWLDILYAHGWSTENPHIPSCSWC